MKRILILGSSPAGVSVIEKIRQRDQESEITLFCVEEHLPYERSLFGDYLGKDIQEKDVLCQPNEFYVTKKINVVTDKKIIRIDFKKSRLVCENRENFSYDILILTDTPRVRFPNIKGTHREGVFSFKRIKDIKSVMKIMPVIDVVAIQPAGLVGLKAAYGFAKRAKEVLLIFPQKNILTELLDSESAVIIERSLQDNGIRLFPENSIEQILGEIDVKAIKLNSGKVMASQVAVITDTKPDLRFLEDSSLTISAEGVTIDERFRTNIEGVFALDQVCDNKSAQIEDRFFSSEELRAQGEFVAQEIFQENELSQSGIKEVNLKLFDLDISIIGETKQAEGVKQYAHADPEQKIYKKIFIKDNLLCGMVLINAPAQKEKLVNLMNNKISTAGLEQQILDDAITVDLFVQPPGESSQALLADEVKAHQEAGGHIPPVDNSAPML